MTGEARELHVVFGAGQVGSDLAARLVSRGRQVRVVRRSAGDVPVGAEVVRGDALDAKFCAAAAKGAAVVYHCVNPPYFTRIWAEQVPRLTENLVAAAGRTGARLVVLDNVYMLGRPAGRPLDDQRPLAPASRKGAIRARAAERIADAHRRGEVRAVTGRASDFYGPGGAGTQFESRFWSRLLAGRPVQLLMNPATPHSWHYIPDVAAALAELGEAPDEVTGRAWMLPVAPPATTGEMVARFAAALGRPAPPIQRVPPLVRRGMSLFLPILRELEEMLYQWDEPFVVDDAPFRERFRTAPTPLDHGARAMAQWAARRYGPGA
jgi:nucleoside-diphosphate-sugar epimerase